MEKDWREILEERIEEHGFYLYYNPPGDGMCFYNAAGKLLEISGYLLKGTIFEELRANRYDGNGNDRFDYISGLDIEIGKEERPLSYEKALDLLENNWANDLVVKTLSIIYKRTIIILTAYWEEPKDYFIEFKAEDSKAPPLYLGYTGDHYVALKERSKKQDSNDQKTSTDDLQQRTSPNSARPTMPNYNVTLGKRGLTEQEFWKSVEDKLQQFGGNKMKTNVGEVIKNVYLKETKTTGKLDQRRKSTKEYVKRGFLTDKKTAPSKLLENQRDKKGKQGQQRFDEKIRARYHHEQHELFVKEWSEHEMFKDIFRPKGSQICWVGGKISGLYSIPDNQRLLWRRLSPTEFCNVVDKITKKYLKDYHLPHNEIVSEKEEVDRVYELCLNVLMGRFIEGMLMENDLMNPDSYNQWRNHFLVIISFSVLCVVLYGLRKKAKGKVRGYSHKFVTKQIQCAADISHTPTLQTKDVKKPNRISFITTFNPSLPHTSNIIEKHRHLPLSSNRCKKVFPQPPVVAFRCSPNLRDTLVTAKLPSNSTTSHPQLRPGSFRCGENCATCPYISNGLTNYTFFSTGETRTITSHMTCDTKNLIYLIQCNRCNLQYIGETKRRLKDRFYQHRCIVENTNLKAKPTNAAKHFIDSPNHSANDMELIAIEEVFSKRDSVRKAREAFLISRGKTAYPNGLNAR